MTSVALIWAIVVNPMLILTVHLASVGCMISNGPIKATEIVTIKNQLEIIFVKTNSTLTNVVWMAMTVAPLSATFPNVPNVNVNFPIDRKIVLTLKP